MTEVTQSDLTAEIAKLAAMDPLDYDLARKPAAERLGVRVGTLDDQVAGLRQSNAKAREQGPAGILVDPTPWPAPIDGTDVLDSVVAALKRFMILSECEAVTVALWTMFAHAHDAADNSPILCVKSPEKRCGKSTLLSIVATLVPRHLPAASVSPAALFRSIEKYQPTFLIDEADTFLRAENEEMRGILNSGFSRASACILRCDGEDNNPRPFGTWCPKLIALIGNLPDTLEDRSLVVLLRRKLKHEEIERFIRKHHDEMHVLRSKLARWAKDNVQRITGAEPDLPAGLNDRSEDCWRPLLAIADAAGGQWPEAARRAALGISAGTEDDDKASAGVKMLTHIRSLFETANCGELKSTELAKLLNENEQWEWGEYRGGKEITPRGVAKLLGRFKIKPRRGRQSNSYHKADFEDAWRRYAPPPSVGCRSASSTSSVSSESSIYNNRLIGFSAAQTSSTVSPTVELENREKARKSAASELVEDTAGDAPTGGYRNGHAHGAVPDVELF